MTTDLTKKRRQRHVASDEAHAWARSLPLNNPNAKTVLRALALYVNGEGSCFVGLEQLAEDTDLSADTVRRRMVWLEQIGAIVRMAQWLDANGRRNSEGVGKRTSDEIRLLLQADVDDIERAARGEEIAETSENSSTETTAISPSSPQGLNSPPETVSPTPALGQPSQSCDHLTSEPEPESSPQPPSGGSVDVEGWKEFESDWQEPILRQQLAQQVWLALKPEERLLARSAARGYVAHRKSQRKPPNVIGAHLFLRERAAWEGFAKRDPGGTRRGDGAFAPNSSEAKAIKSLHLIAGRTSAFFDIWRRADGSVNFPKAMTPQLLALAQMPDTAEWRPIDYRGARAWEEFLDQFFQHGEVRTHYRSGEVAPWPWPPSTEGKIYTPEATPPPTQLGELSDQDAADFK